MQDVSAPERDSHGTQARPGLPAARQRPAVVKTIDHIDGPTVGAGETEEGLDWSYPYEPCPSSEAIDAARAVLPRTLDFLLDGVAQHLHPGFQLYVSRHGEELVSVAGGWARRGAPMDPTTKLPFLSCNKLILGLAFGRAWEMGLLYPDQPVAEIVPEFGAHGKGHITFLHLLTHTTGLNPDPIYSVMFQDRAACMEAIYDAELSDPGATGRMAYYALFWAFMVLGEALERVTGRELFSFVREEVLEPLGVADMTFRIPVDEFNEHWNDLGVVFDTQSEEQPNVFPWLSEPWHYDFWAPGVLGFAPVSVLGRALESLLPTTRGNRILQPQTIAAMTARHRVGLLDQHLRGYVSWGLGMAVDGWYFGNQCSSRTFGHGGLNTAFGMADPESGVVVSLIANGFLNGKSSVSRDHGTVDAVYADLGLGQRQPPPKVVAVEHEYDASDRREQALAEFRYWKPGSDRTPPT